MSGDNQSNTNNNTRSRSPPQADMPRNRRSSVTSAAFSNLFPRSNSTSAGTSAYPGSVTSAVVNDQKRRLSISTIGLSGTSPTSGSAFGRRRGSVSTSSGSIDESAIDEDDTYAGARTVPNTPFTRRMSFGTQAAMRTMQRNGGQSSPGNNDQGYNWSEQLRSRAESTVASGSRPSFSFASGTNNSPPRPGFAGGGGPPSPHHTRTQSVSDMPAPPAAAPKPRQERPKPDAFQERILKGDFYMD